ncbi:hypothetical protein PENTCL1PPCAC_28038 [Pristionchus entomophagus]|uniref:Rho-GAP domain-containing protein n=1 Tax=Pristionchus entomophagus TaxID=358040 RepID=A0AAV5UHL9_9BILA|nr:hypothetical protein PENTCL1PPCAC_28038 [Pristionchus entomophagus]
MEKTNKAIRQKIGRMKTNLGLSEKRDELASVSGIDQRNQKIIASINVYRKNLSSCMKTGLKEEVPEKRKKKCDEYVMASDLAADSKELRLNGSTCLYKVLDSMSAALNTLMDERVRTEMNTEKRVLEGMCRYLEMDKALNKSKERLTHTTVDVDIARKALNSKKDDEGRQSELQEEFDTNLSKLESLKDSTITDIFTLAAKEQEIALVFAAYAEELLEYHRFALRTFENILPEIRRDIANARPRPMFGVDLEEHLRHANRPISVVLEKCCTILRATAMKERGVFRVNGNNTKIRRIKAAFDAGQMLDDRTDAFAMDPHSVCSVLKSYLRELPDPLLTNRLHGDWIAATRVEGEERLLLIESCLAQLPPAYHNNLAFLVNFLCELLQYESSTMMSAGNLAIVFGPNLIGNGNETDNVTGSKIVESLLQNEARFFHRSLYYREQSPIPVSHSPQMDRLTQMIDHPIARVNSTPTGGRTTFTRAMAKRNEFGIPQNSGSSLSIDTQGSFRRNDSPALTAQTVTNATFSANSSGSSGESIRRPRITAPLPPQASSNNRDNREDMMTRSMYTDRTGGNASDDHQASLSEVVDQLNALRGDRSTEYERFRDGSRDSSFDSIDEIDDEAGARSLDRPLRPPPPSLRSGAHGPQKARPVSYNIAVGGLLTTANEPTNGSTGRERSVTSPSTRREVHETPPEMVPAQSTIISTVTSSLSTGPIHRSIVSIEGPQRTPSRNRPPLPNKPQGLQSQEAAPIVTSSTIPLKPKESTKL